MYGSVRDVTSRKTLRESDDGVAGSSSRWIASEPGNLHPLLTPQALYSQTESEQEEQIPQDAADCSLSGQPRRFSDMPRDALTNTSTLPLGRPFYAYMYLALLGRRSAWMRHVCHFGSAIKKTNESRQIADSPCHSASRLILCTPKVQYGSLP